jgi:hypothetical protein
VAEATPTALGGGPATPAGQIFFFFFFLSLGLGVAGPPPVAGSNTILSDAKLRSNPNEYDRFNKKFRLLNLSSEMLLFLIGDCKSSMHGVISEIDL